MMAGGGGGGGVVGLKILGLTANGFGLTKASIISASSFVALLKFRSFTAHRYFPVGVIGRGSMPELHLTSEIPNPYPKPRKKLNPVLFKSLA